MTTVLQISDPHFGTERRWVVQALLAFARDQKPEAIVLSGDLTQRARRRQFDAARRFAAELSPAAVLAVPGNHDIPLFNVFARITRPYGNFMRAFGDDLEPQFENDEVLIVCVNTTRPRRHKDGEIAAEQVQRVAKRLHRAHASQVRIVVVHQPVVAAVPSDEHNVLHGADQALPAWAEAGADVVMGGHIHLPYVLPLHTSQPNLARALWAVQAGTAVSHRTRGQVPNSVNVLRCHGGQRLRACTVERWDHRESGHFEQVTTTALALST